MPALDVARFREVVGHFATGVVVVTAAGERGPLGFTCQSFGSLSVEPILISFAARTDSTSWPQISAQGQLAINVLAAHQESLARVFATSTPDKFSGVAWSSGANGAPLLANALAHLEGTILSVSTHGDHDVAVVAVARVESFDGSPLVYYRGGFGSFTS
jgi:flavin reductase (DIM6/NTAB) family NADH-FMN oxidoreductase RutF